MIIFPSTFLSQEKNNEVLYPLYKRTPFHLNSFSHNKYSYLSSPKQIPTENPKHIHMTSLPGLDSIIVRSIYDDLDKYIFRYNSNGRINQKIFETFSNSKLMWIPGWKLTFSFDAYGNIVSKLREIWNMNQLINEWRETYSYDLNGKLVSKIKERWKTSSWLKSEKESFTYDLKGNMNAWLYQKWYDNEWHNDLRNLYTYRSDTSIILNQIWNNVSWIDNSSTLSVYNSKGDIIYEQTKIKKDQQLVNREQNSYSYNSDGKIILRIRKYWSWDRWVEYMRYSYNYDPNGSKILELWEYWSENQWTNGNRHFYLYNSNNEVSVVLWEQWYEDNWINENRFTYTYDENGNFVLWYAEKWYGSNWGGGGGTLIFSDSLGNYHKYSGRQIELFYSPITGISEGNSNIMNFSLEQNYPNPFNPITTINYSLTQSGMVQLIVYDLLGRKVTCLVNKEQSVGNYKVKFNAASLTSGIYFYKLELNGFTKTKKLILLK